MTTSFLLSFPCDVWLRQPAGGTLRRSPCRGDALAPPCFAWSARGGPWPFRWAPRGQLLAGLLQVVAGDDEVKVRQLVRMLARHAVPLAWKAALPAARACQPRSRAWLAVAVCQRAGRRGILVCGKGDTVTSHSDPICH